jgi:hypothetical protein
MKYFKIAIAAMSLFLCLIPATAGAISVTPPPASSLKIDAPVIVTGYAFTGPKLLYVQLFNSSDRVVDVTNWQVEYTISAQTEAVKMGELDGKIKPGGYAVMGEQGSVPAADFLYTVTIPTGVTGSVNGIKLIPAGQYKDSNIVVKTDATTPYWKRNISTTTGNYLTTFSSFMPDATFILYGNGLYEFPEDTLIQFSEILANPRGCSPLEQAGDCHDYVKFYNPTSLPMDLSLFRLRVGYQGQNSTSSNTFLLAGIIPAGGYLTVSSDSDARPISLTNSGGFVWLEDLYGTKRYDTTVSEYPESDSKKGQAWAYDRADGTWKWTLQPVPGNGASSFVFPVEKPKVVSSGVACKEGQYRSEETNRCRSLASVTALAPCDDDEERNPETNRCRKLAAAANAELVPCKEGQERNPETNRCRNATALSPPDAAFKTEPIAETGSVFMGWWALGSVGILAVGYGVWEWRHEMIGAMQKVGTFFTSGK